MHLSPGHDVGFAVHYHVVDLPARVGILRPQGGACADLRPDGVAGGGRRLACHGRCHRDGGRSGGRIGCRGSIGQIGQSLGTWRAGTEQNDKARGQRHERKGKTQRSVGRDVHRRRYCPIRHGESTVGSHARSNTAAMWLVSAFLTATKSTGCPSSRAIEVITPASNPQGWMAAKRARSVLTLSASPCRVTHLRTATPMEASLRGAPSFAVDRK